MTLVEAAKYRWEFMRRNKSYHSDYHQYMEATEVIKNKCKQEMARKWPLLFGQVQNPDLSFEEIYIDKGKNARRRKVAKDQQQWLETGYRVAQECSTRRIRQGVLVDIDDPINDEITIGDLLILIKPYRINSIARMKEDVCKLIDAHFSDDFSPFSSVELPPQASIEEHEELVNSWFRGGYRDEAQIYNTDFDVILRMGDWIDQDHMSFDKAAAKAYPEKYQDTEDEPGDTEGAVRAVRKVHARYRYLIEKGFRKINAT
jgi:hypothetical protein